MARDSPSRPEALRDAPGRGVGPSSHPAADTGLAFLEAMFRAAPVGVAFLGTDLRYRRINARLAEMNGRPVEAHIGRRPSEVIGEPGKVLEEMLQTVLSTGEDLRALELETMTPTGQALQLRVSLFAVRGGGGLLGVGGVIVDITPTKRAGVAGSAAQPPR